MARANSEVLGSTVKSSAEHAYDVIRERLVLLDIAPGEPLNDDKLGAELGYGRTPVREALKRLERDRLVVAFPRRGTFATAVDMTELSSISEIRRQLEPLAASRAARSANAETRAALSALADEVAALGDAEEPRDVLRKDVLVHQRIYQAAGNTHLEDILVSLDAHATRIWCLFLDRLPNVAHHVREHEPLLRSIVDGDADMAAKLTLSHVDGFEQAVRRLL
nr:GntR family transcriptional regulator [Rhodococcus sp. (in: high G+C Gram-positive bacteria)]